MRCKVWKHSLCLLLSVLLPCLLFSACASQKKQIQFFSMDTIMEITAYGNCDDALTKARERIETLDSLLDATDPDSAVSRLQTRTMPDKDLQHVLRIVQQVTALTDNALDVTLYPLIDAWGFYSKAYRVPTADEISSLLQKRGSWSIAGGVYTGTPGVRLDLGCAAKGYAAQCAADVLRENGVQAAVLSLGGNVQTLGQKPDGSDWLISVADPGESGGTLGNLRVGECAVVTSGSYQRYFEADGEIYHHILDPETGYPAHSGLSAVTVVCADGCEADALSTALFVMGMEKAKALYALHNISFEALFVTDNNEVYLTGGLDGRFEQTSEQYAPYQILK